MAELADALVLGTSGQPCRFKSCYPHKKSPIESGFFFCVFLKITIYGAFHQKLGGVAACFADVAHNLFCGISCVVIDADNATVLMAAEDRRLRPTDIVGNMIPQKFTLNLFLAVEIVDLAEFNFVINFNCRI